jgi:AraC family transcriptional regulator
MDKSGQGMDKFGTVQSGLLSRQVSQARYFFLDLAPSAPRDLAVTLGGREHCNPDYLIRRDRYDFTVLEIVESGQGWVELDGRRQSLRPGTVYAYGPRTRCEISTDAQHPLVKVFICLRGSRAARRLAAAGVPPGQVRAVAPVAEISTVAEDLIREGQQEGPLVRDICRHLFEVLLLKLETLAAPKDLTDHPGRDRFLRCKALIDREAETLGTLHDIARSVGLESSSVCRLFRRFQGTSPYQYLLRRKMNLAAEYLMQHGGSVKEVAQRAGYPDPFHFSRVFKSVHGVSPREVGRIGSRLPV